MNNSTDNCHGGYKYPTCIHGPNEFDSSSKGNYISHTNLTPGLVGDYGTVVNYGLRPSPIGRSSSLTSRSPSIGSLIHRIGGLEIIAHRSAREFRRVSTNINPLMTTGGSCIPTSYMTYVANREPSIMINTKARRQVSGLAVIVHRQLHGIRDRESENENEPINDDLRTYIRSREEGHNPDIYKNAKHR